MFTNWRKSTKSGNQGNCLEWATDGDLVGVRDSKHPEPVLVFTRAQWRVFIEAVKTSR